MLSSLGKIIFTIGFVVASFFGYHQPKQDLGAFVPTGGGTYRLQSSVGSTDNTITLSSFKEPINNTPYTMAYLGSDIEYATVEPFNTSRKEFVSFTGITQNSDGTATLTGVKRGLPFSNVQLLGCTASTTLQQTHPGQSVLILSDNPCLFAEFPAKRNNEYLTGIWTFGSTSPILNPNASATSTNQLATRGYAEGLANAGAATSTETNGGIVELATRTEFASTTASTLTKPLVVQAQHGTSTPGANIVATGGTGETYGVVTRDDGTIDPNFIATSTPSVLANNQNIPPKYQFGGEVNTSTSTIGTLSIGTLHATSSTFTARGIGYTWPAILPSATTTKVSSSGGVQFWDSGPVILFDRSLQAASSTFGTYDFDAKNGLRIILQSTGLASAGTVGLQFNRDTAGNYYSRDFTADRSGFVFQNESIAGTSIQLVSSATTSPVTLDFFVPNVSGTQKTFGWTGGIGAASAIPKIQTGTGTWQNTTAQITQVTLTSGVNFSANSRLTVIGY